MGGSIPAIRRAESVQDFSARAGPFLLRNEAAHNLMLGITTDLQHARAAPRESPLPTPPAQTPYSALVEAGDDVVAAAVRTPPYNLVLSLVDGAPLEDVVDLLVADVRRQYPDLGTVQGPSAVSARFAAQWARTTGRRARKSLAMRIFAPDAATPPSGVPGVFRWATLANRDLIIAWVPQFMRSLGERDDPDAPARIADARLRAREPDPRADPTGIALWIDGEPVSMAAYVGPTPNGVRVNLVYTPPEHRRRGYANALVAALSQRLLDAGYRFCFLYTDLANPTSNHIYQQT